MKWWRENIIRQQTRGFEEPIDAKFDMLEGGQYTIRARPATPFGGHRSRDAGYFARARNAVAIAKAAGGQYAPDRLQKAELSRPRRDCLRRKQGDTPIGTAARGATRSAKMLAS